MFCRKIYCFINYLLFYLSSSKRCRSRKGSRFLARKKLTRFLGTQMWSEKKTYALFGDTHFCVISWFQRPMGKKDTLIFCGTQEMARDIQYCTLLLSSEQNWRHGGGIKPVGLGDYPRGGPPHGLHHGIDHRPAARPWWWQQQPTLHPRHRGPVTGRQHCWG